MDLAANPGKSERLLAKELNLHQSGVNRLIVEARSVLQLKKSDSAQYIGAKYRDFLIRQSCYAIDDQSTPELMYYNGRGLGRY